LSTHTSNKSNPHEVTKEQLGLGNVDNTADADKEVKKAATADLATKATQDSVGNVINTTYATISYADAIGASAATDLSTHTSNKSNPHNVTKAQLGLDKVDNTSDAEKRDLFAETAGNVGSSEKDGDGNVITATYATKDELEATIYVYFPETIISNSQHKYDRATLWLATQKGIINANVRDSFSAGGRSIMKTIDGRYVSMPAVFRKIAEHIDMIVDILTTEASELLYENWSINIKQDRISQWINLVISETCDLSKRKDAKAVLEQIFCDYNMR
jgi:hypothetical protein